MFNNSTQNPKMNLNISITTAVKTTAVVLLMIMAVRFLGDIMPIILLFFAALFLAIAFNPVVAKINKGLRIRNRSLATGISFFLILLIASGLIAVVFSQINQLVIDLSDTFQDRDSLFGGQDNVISNLITRYELNEHISDLASNVAARFTSDINTILDLFQQIYSALAALFIIVAMAFMILLEGPSFLKQLGEILPKERSKKLKRLGSEMREVISGYVLGQIIIAIIGGLVSMIFMTLIGVSNALALSSIVAFCALIPLIGALIGAIIVVSLTLLVDANQALILIVFFFGYQQIENLTFQPWFQGQQTNLSTLQVFIAFLIGAKIAGVGGALLFVPIAACLKILIIDYLITHRDYLEKRYLRKKVKKKNTS